MKDSHGRISPDAHSPAGRFLEFLHFGFVGLAGLAVDVSLYYLLQATSFSHLQARALSFWPAVSTNWLFNRVSTFRHRKKRQRLRQWAEFTATSTLGFCLSWGTYYFLTTWLPAVGMTFFDEYRFIALFPGMALATLFNYLVSTFFIYSNHRD
ncbi:MAG: GtrA family protein [Gammaproteobacteria bacterium]|nr:GtrA family protein [Gammaproteobacteria bacterium]